MSNPDLRQPHVERTTFTPQEPPEAITLHFCPACGALIRGGYNLEPARKKCSKTWHLAEPVAQRYVARNLDADTRAA